MLREGIFVLATAVAETEGLAMVLLSAPLAIVVHLNTYWHSRPLA
jgi:hypothetical protein